MGQATLSVTGLPLLLSSQASYMIVSGFRAALDLDTYPHTNLIRPRYPERAKSGGGKPVLIMHRVFSPHVLLILWISYLDCEHCGCAGGNVYY